MYNCKRLVYIVVRHDTFDHIKSSICFICRYSLGATYFDKTRITMDHRCPQCSANNNELSSFPIMPNESFTFNYDSKRGVELGFKPRLKYA
jgi:hypothetical protein